MGSKSDERPPDNGHYKLKLFVTGTTPISARAVVNMRKLCEEYLPDSDLEVIDISQHPELAKENQLVAAPTLIKELPLPIRRTCRLGPDRS